MSFRNRCQVLGAGRVIHLSVPLLGGRDQKGLTSAIQIDNEQDWRTQHWRTLESCYNKSPFFMHYADSLHAVIFTGHQKLWDLNLDCFDWANKKLGGLIKVELSAEFQKQMPEGVADLRNKYLPANRERFSLAPYQQVFGEKFEGNLSILDLLFNLGPQSKEYLLAQSGDL